MARRSRTIDTTRWDRFQNAFLTLSAGSIADTLQAAGTVRETMLRTRGSLCAWIDGAGAPPTAVLVSIGFLLVPEGLGSTVVSEPFADANAPWMYFTSFILGYEERVTDVVDVPGLTIYRETIDVKAMRIFRSDQEMQVVVTNTTIGGAATVNVALQGRQLFGH